MNFFFFKKFLNIFFIKDIFLKVKDKIVNDNGKDIINPILKEEKIKDLENIIKKLIIPKYAIRIDMKNWLILIFSSFTNSKDIIP